MSRVFPSFMIMACGPDYLPVLTGALGPEGLARARVEGDYFLADELGYYELSCMGHPHLRTPNLDRLAAEGVRFTQALAGSSLCAPTRCCLMTGKHSGRTSVRTSFTRGRSVQANQAVVARMAQ